jgi:hypothetical protein
LPAAFPLYANGQHEKLVCYCLFEKETPPKPLMLPGFRRKQIEMDGSPLAKVM